MKLNYAKNLIINYLFIIIFEVVFKIFVLNTFDIGIFFIFVTSFFNANILTCICLIFKNKYYTKVTGIVLKTAIFLIFAALTIYYSFYKTLCGLDALIYGQQVLSFYEAILTHIIKNAPILLVYFVILLCALVLDIKQEFNYQTRIFKDALVLLFGAFIINLTLVEVNIKDLKDLVYVKNDLMETTNALGVLSSIELDTVKLLNDFQESVEIPVVKAEKLDETLEYNVSDIDFYALIDKETDETVKDMHEVFANTNPTNKNAYTGIFKNKNLIFIVAEGFSPIAVNENLTPTLYKLVNSSFVFNNYYQPLFNCSTSDGEFINQLSILPGVATCSMKKTIGTYQPYSVGNIFKKYGYTANAFHGWTYNYYSRDKIMPNLGYNYYGYDRFKKGYDRALKGIKDSWPTSDIDVINSSFDIYSNDSLFVAYYMTISGHLEYNFGGGNAIASKNKAYVKDISASDAIKAYIATQIEFDKSMAILLEKLEEKGILDDTVIVISPDHYPYGLSNDEIKGYVDYLENPNFDLYKNNLVIYNSKMPTIQIDKYVSSLDLLPTILNLFGISYDSRLLMGTDIFSSSDDLVIFNNKSWITAKGRFDYLKKKFEAFGDDVDEDYINKINDLVELKFNMSKLLISKDYYRKLGGI